MSVFPSLGKPERLRGNFDSTTLHFSGDQLNDSCGRCRTVAPQIRVSTRRKRSMLANRRKFNHILVVISTRIADDVLSNIEGSNHLPAAVDASVIRSNELIPKICRCNQMEMKLMWLSQQRLVRAHLSKEPPNYEAQSVEVNCCGKEHMGREHKHSPRPTKPTPMSPSRSDRSQLSYLTEQTRAATC